MIFPGAAALKAQVDQKEWKASESKTTNKKR
jgi:hypothetical protein